MSKSSDKSKVVQSGSPMEKLRGYIGMAKLSLEKELRNDKTSLSPYSVTEINSIILAYESVLSTMKMLPKEMRIVFTVKDMITVGEVKEIGQDFIDGEICINEKGEVGIWVLDRESARKEGNVYYKKDDSTYNWIKYGRVVYD